MTDKKTVTIEIIDKTTGDKYLRRYAEQAKLVIEIRSPVRASLDLWIFSYSKIDDIVMVKLFGIPIYRSAGFYFGFLGMDFYRKKVS